VNVDSNEPVEDEATHYHVQFTMEEDDFVAFVTYYYRHVPAGKRSIRLLYTLVLTVVFIFLLYDYRSKSAEQSIAQLTAYILISLLLMGGIYFLFVAWLRPKMARASVRSGPRRRMLGPTEMMLSDTYLTAKVPEGTGRIAWRHIDHAGKTSEHILLHVERMNGFIIPCRAFADEAEAEECLRYIHGRMTAEKAA